MLNVFVATIESMIINTYEDNAGAYSSAMFTTHAVADQWLETEMKKIGSNWHCDGDDMWHLTVDTIEYLAYIRTDAVFSTLEEEKQDQQKFIDKVLGLS